MEKRYTELELVKMPQSEFETIMDCIRSGSFRLLGISWGKYIKWYRDPVNHDIVIIYE